MNSVALKLAAYAENQEDLVTRHAPLVKRIAYHLLARLPDTVQADDLIQSGMIGLLEAVRNFEQGHGASFETYSGIRIRGAMLDELRRLDYSLTEDHEALQAAYKDFFKTHCSIETVRAAERTLSTW